MVGGLVGPGVGLGVGRGLETGRLVGLEVKESVGGLLLLLLSMAGEGGKVGATLEAAGVTGLSFWDSKIHQMPATIPPPSRKAKTAKMRSTVARLEVSSLVTLLALSLSSFR